MEVLTAPAPSFTVYSFFSTSDLDNWKTPKPSISREATGPFSLLETVSRQEGIGCLFASIIIGVKKKKWLKAAVIKSANVSKVGRSGYSRTRQIAHSVSGTALWDMLGNNSHRPRCTPKTSKPLMLPLPCSWFQTQGESSRNYRDLRG